MTPRLSERRCVICDTAFQPRRASIETCGTRSCACKLAYRRGSRVARRRKMKTCPECLRAYQPKRTGQATCGRHCGAARAYRRSAARQKGIAIARQARHRQQRAAITAQIQDMAPLAIWQLAYRRGQQALWQKLVRAGRIEPRVSIPASTGGQST